MIKFFKHNLLGNEVEIEFESGSYAVGRIRTKVRSIEIQGPNNSFKIVINNNIDIYVKSFSIENSGFLMIKSNNNAIISICFLDDNAWENINTKSKKIKIVKSDPLYDVGKNIDEFIGSIYEIISYDESGKGVYVNLLGNGTEYLIFNTEFEYIY